MEGEGKKGSGSIIGSIAAKMKANKKLEIAVYALLIGAGILMFAVSSCDAGKTQSADGGSSGAYTMSAKEKKLADTLSLIVGAGEVSVMITEDENGTIQGVIVVAEGAADIGVRNALHTAAVTALGVKAENVGIYTMYKNSTEG